MSIPDCWKGCGIASQDTHNVFDPENFSEKNSKESTRPHPKPMNDCKFFCTVDFVKGNEKPDILRQFVIRFKIHEIKSFCRVTFICLIQLKDGYIKLSCHQL